MTNTIGMAASAMLTAQIEAFLVEVTAEPETESPSVRTPGRPRLLPSLCR